MLMITEYPNFSLEALTPEVGAIVSGVDLAAVDEETLADLRQAWLWHQALFFRNQSASAEALHDFAERFADLGPDPSGAGEVPARVRVLRESEHFQRTTGNRWHTDLRCDSDRPIATLLHLGEGRAGCGDTLIASMHTAYEGLSDAMQRFLSNLSALHCSHPVHKGRYGRVEYPLVRAHPETGRLGLCIDPSSTMQILSLSPSESQTLLEFLIGHATRPEFICHFRSEPGAVALWDNRCTQQMAVFTRAASAVRGAQLSPKLSREREAQQASRGNPCADDSDSEPELDRSANGHALRRSSRRDRKKPDAESRGCEAKIRN